MKTCIAYGSAILIIVYLVALPFMNHQKQYDMSSYKEVIEQRIDMEVMLMQEQTYVRRFYQLHQENYTYALVYAKESTMDVEEIAIIQGRDEAQGDYIEQQFFARIEKQKQVFDGYGIEQMELLKQAQVHRFENTVLLIIAQEPDRIRKAIEGM